MRKALFVWLAIGLGPCTIAQKYVLREGVITFFSDATVEDIKAENKKVTSLFNAATSDIVFSVPIMEFQFEKKLMQEHFNEKYLESEKFPRATFTGKVSNFSLNSTGEQQVTAKGKLTIHGVTKEVEIPGTIDVQTGKLSMKAKFPVKLEDFKVKIPQLLWQNIAEQVEVTVDLSYQLQ